MITSRTRFVGVVSILAANLVLGGVAAVEAQDGDSRSRGGGARWALVDAVGYGGLGFGLGVLATLAIDGAGAGPTEPPAAMYAHRGAASLNYGFGNVDLVSGPTGTELAVIGTATVTGTVAGAVIGIRADRKVATGVGLDGVHRAAVIAGAVMAGGTLGAVAAVPLIRGEGEGTPLGSDERTVALLVLVGGALGTLYVLRNRHELGSRSVSLTPARTRDGGVGLNVLVTW